MLIIGDVNNNFNSSQGLSFINKTENIKFLGRVSDNELISLYSNAKAFIFPSLYEGFGIPPIEAQSCGCPVISSNAGSLPEILNDSATFFNPYCVKSIRDTLRETLSNKDTLELLTKRGYDNVKRFNWDKSAEKITKTVLNK